MRTLGVALEHAGKTNQILADTDAQVNNQKMQYVTEKPVIKFDAPVLNEVGDLPIYPFPSSNVSQRNKWVLDCVLEWNGTFIDNDLTIVKTLANNFNGSTDWSDNWDGKYNDHVKGLIAREMETGNYQNLPRPFGPSSSWQVAYTMQLAIVPAGDK